MAELAMGTAVSEELIRLCRERDLLDLQIAGLAAKFAAGDEWDQDGSNSAIDWIRFNCYMTGNTAADLIAVGKNLHRMPESVQAIARGEIGFAHAKAMARTANAVGSKFDEKPLLEKARENSPGKFYYIGNHYRHAADRQGYEAEQAELVDNRRLWITTCDDGTVLVNGVFDPEGGATFRTAIEPLARKSGAADDRSREKRMADAVVDLAMHALDSGLIPQQGSQRTHLNVTTSLETLLGLPDAPAAELEFAPLPISAKTVGRLACDSSVTRILLNSESVVIDVGRATRTISGPARKALNVRDRGCTWPGCERPASWTSGHHLKHWIHGGSNQPPNLTLLCYRHHWKGARFWRRKRPIAAAIRSTPPTANATNPSRRCPIPPSYSTSLYVRTAQTAGGLLVHSYGDEGHHPVLRGLPALEAGRYASEERDPRCCARGCRGRLRADRLA